MKPEPTGIDLEVRSDDDLKELIAAAQRLLDSREKRRRREAIARLKRQAREMGVGIEIVEKRPPEKRRRREAPAATPGPVFDATEKQKPL